MELTHLDNKGKIKMVDVSEKEKTWREGKAYGLVKLRKETMELVLSGQSKKGNILETARLAGIMAAKKTSELIPLCHNINLTSIELDFKVNAQKNEIEIFSLVKTRERTGVEMEALTAVSIAALTIYDMLKAVEKGIEISRIVLLEKSGGKSGNWKNEFLS